MTPGPMRAVRPRSAAPPPCDHGQSVKGEYELVRQVRVEAYRARAERIETDLGFDSGGHLRPTNESIFDPPLTEAEIDAALERLLAGAKESQAVAVAA